MLLKLKVIKCLKYLFYHSELCCFISCIISLVILVGDLANHAHCLIRKALSFICSLSEPLLKIVAASNLPCHTSDCHGYPLRVVENSILQGFGDGVEPDLEHQSSDQALEPITQLVLDKD